MWVVDKTEGTAFPVILARQTELSPHESLESTIWAAEASQSAEVSVEMRGRGSQAVHHQFAAGSDHVQPVRSPMLALDAKRSMAMSDGMMGEKSDRSSRALRPWGVEVKLAPVSVVLPMALGESLSTVCCRHHERS